MEDESEDEYEYDYSSDDDGEDDDDDDEHDLFVISQGAAGPSEYWYQHWLSVIQSDPLALKDAPSFIQNNRKIVMAAVQKDGRALQFAPDLQSDKQVVMAAVSEADCTLPSLPECEALKYASPSFRNDKDVALLFVKHNPDNIKHLNGDLKRDPDILIAAGMYDEDHQDAVVRRQRNDTITTTWWSRFFVLRQPRSTNTNTYRKIVLSTRFALDPTSESEATNFTALFKNSKFYQEGNFILYAPNANYKGTCDPSGEFTEWGWPCRGTKWTCMKVALTAEGYPTDDCCWRYSFRNQLEEAKETGGFMLQLVETGRSGGTVNDAKLGNGQKIELDMAKKMGVKVFQIYRPKEGKDEYGYNAEEPFHDDHIDAITDDIYQWYEQIRESPPHGFVAWR